MVLTNAEKQRLYRQRRDADPVRRAQYLAKKKQKYISDKAVGKRKNVADMTPRERRIQRKVWKKQQSTCRQRRKQDDAYTPPPTPTDIANSSRYVAYLSEQLGIYMQY